MKKVQWHNGLEPAFRVELGEEADKVTFEREHLLSSKPLQMDLLIITKQENIIIQKNIGRIFRKHNIIEYKSPDDYLSINDFYKVYGYACLYQSDTEHVGEISAEDITITFVANHYPRKMLKRLRKERNITVCKKGKGIYYLSGDFIPIQLLINHELSEEENY